MRLSHRYSAPGATCASAALMAALLAVPVPPVRADCASSCQSERYACEESADSSTCGTSFQMCVQNCIGGADSYGAIAYSEATGNYGYSYEFDSQNAAERRALAECGGEDCEVVVWFNQACGALATAADGAWGADWGDSQREAEGKARSTCAEYSDESCTILTSLCSD